MQVRYQAAPWTRIALPDRSSEKATRSDYYRSRAAVVVGRPHRASFLTTASPGCLIASPAGGAERGTAGCAPPKSLAAAVVQPPKARTMLSSASLETEPPIATAARAASSGSPSHRATEPNRWLSQAEGQSDSGVFGASSEARAGNSMGMAGQSFHKRSSE